ncbi:MAG: hypothetical protein EOO16_14900 [Chitinophagaceae bacterium]|nr:MAG: hypothetical protein EOO16_14900 [Chitinophagaceae bacterium]
MNPKENKGGVLRNDQVEQDLAAHGNQQQNDHPFHGSQDTGDFMPRQQGSETQQRDGFLPEDEEDTGRA